MLESAHKKNVKGVLLYWYTFINLKMFFVCMVTIDYYYAII